jgi:hypothetical protein
MTVKRIEKNCDKFEKVCITGRVDTVRIENTLVVTERDTVINFYFPRDTVYLETPLKKIPGKKIDPKLFNTDVSYLTAGYAWSTAQMVNGVLKHYLESGDTTIQIQLKGALKTIETLETRLKSSHQRVTIKENTKFAEFCIKVFWVLAGIVLLGIGYLIYRFQSILLRTSKKLF